MFVRSQQFNEGVRILNQYFTLVPSSRRPWSSFVECLDYFTIDQEDKKRYSLDESRWRKIGFMENLAYQANDTFKKDPQRFNKAIKALADATTKTKIPSEKSFTDAFLSATSFTFNDFKKAVSDGTGELVSKAANVTAVGIGTYLAWLTVVALVLYFINSSKKRAA